MIKNLHPAFYGNTVLQRVYCPECKGQTIVLRGIKQCCEKPVNQELKKQNEYVAAPRNKRIKPSKKEQDLLYVLQNSRCLYCDRKIGTMYECNGKVMFTREAWDHYIPFSFSFDNRKTNFVLSCHICNGIKSNKMFDTLEEVKNYVEYRRKKKGYTYYEDEVLPRM